jgi:hypothetical protein
MYGYSPSPYLHYYQHLEQLCERLALPVDDFIVSIVCENPERKEALRKHLYALGPVERGGVFFWLSDRTKLDLMQPQQLLYGEVWTPAAGEQGSICARHPSCYPHSAWCPTAIPVLNS